MIDLLADHELPQGFTYPPRFKRIVGLDLLNLEPWHILAGPSLRHTKAGLDLRYPDRRLIPFARRQDNDDIACWSASNAERILIIHDFASSGWELEGEYPSFYDWLRQAIEDLIDFDC